MKTVLFFTDLLVGTHIPELNGVYERARRYGWHVVEIEYSHLIRPLGDYIKTWKPAGCIVDCSPLTSVLDRTAFRGLPVVYLHPDHETLKRPCTCVKNDPVPLAQLAARELSALDCAAYGYVGWSEPTSWSEDRRTAFINEMKTRGVAAKSFTEHWSSRDRLHCEKKLAAWLKSMPKPCGIFAANDDTASLVTEVCHFVGLNCPKDVAVIGVDNLEIICENAVTSLSSIEVDFTEAGRLAADLLARLLSDPKRKPERATFASARVVRRHSTRPQKACDAHVARALERIRREACFGLKAIDVINDFGASRRTAEQRFRAATGKTILEEINDHRLERAFQLLRRQDYPISLIAEQCGWKRDVFLKRIFKKRTGMTMREWRRKALAPTLGPKPGDPVSPARD